MSRCEHLNFFTKLEVFNVLGWSIFIKPVLLNNYISGTQAITAKQYVMIYYMYNYKIIHNNRHFFLV